MKKVERGFYAVVSSLGLLMALGAMLLYGMRLWQHPGERRFTDYMTFFLAAACAVRFYGLLRSKNRWGGLDEREQRLELVSKDLSNLLFTGGFVLGVSMDLLRGTEAGHWSMIMVFVFLADVLWVPLMKEQAGEPRLG